MVKTRKRILLVDDNPVSQKLTEKIFLNDGYEVFLAWDEASCLRSVVEKQPEAILMDVIFPDGDGRKMVTKLRALPEGKSIPVVFATNTIDMHMDKGEETIEVDGETYKAFAKPLHYPKLLSVMRKEINRRRNNSKI